MAILREDDPREALRRQLIEEALEYRRRHPVPPQREVLAEILSLRSYRPADHGAPDSTTLLREDRGGWPDGELEVTPAVQTDESRGIVPTRDNMLVKAKGDFSTLTPDGRAVVDTNRLIRSPEVKRTLAVLEGKIQASRSSLETQAFQTKKK